MRYVIAGYVVILTLLFFYSVQLVWRRRRLDRAVARAVSVAGSATAEPTDAGRGA
jgi:hypothetical protein